MKSANSWHRFRLLLPLVVLLVFTGSIEASQDPCIQVALIGEFQRSIANTAQPFGLEIVRGAKIAMKELQKGPTRICRELITLDIRSSVSNIPDLIQKNVKDNHVRVFLGLGSSDQAIVASRALSGLPAILITPTASSDKLSNANSQTIMMFPLNRRFAEALASEAVKRGIKSVATVYSENSEYSKNMARAFRVAFEGLGGSVKIEMSARFGQIPKDQLLTLKQTKVDRIFLPLYELDTAKVVSFLHQNKIPSKYIGSDAWGTYSTVLKTYTKEVPIDAFYPDIYSPQIKNSINERFMKAYTNEGGGSPSDLAAFSYDGLKLADRLFSVCSSADAVTKISHCLKAAMPFNATTGVLTHPVGISVDPHIQVKAF